MVRPAGADVGDHQAEHEGASHVITAVSHQVNLQETRWRPAPIGEGAHWNVAPCRPVPPALAPTGHGGTERLLSASAATLADSNRSLTSGSQSRWPWRSMDSSKWGSAAFRRLPQMRSLASRQDHRCPDRLVVDALTPGH